MERNLRVIGEGQNRHADNRELRECKEKKRVYKHMARRLKREVDQLRAAAVKGGFSPS
jgi:hypothetical protein